MISSYCLGRAPLFFLQSSENRSAKKPISWSAIPPSSADCTRAVPIGSLVPLDEIATAIARCAGCLADGVATGESIDSGEGRAHPLRWEQQNLLRPLSLSYDASAGSRRSRPPLLSLRSCGTLSWKGLECQDACRVAVVPC